MIVLLLVPSAPPSPISNASFGVISPNHHDLNECPSAAKTEGNWSLRRSDQIGAFAPGRTTRSGHQLQVLGRQGLLSLGGMALHSPTLRSGLAHGDVVWVTRRFRHSFTKSRVSNPLSPPTVTACVPGSFSSMISAASRSAVPLA
jgi:hypothetical protein